MDFIKRYENLNTAQRQAVDCIDGPVMVIAGPGTGKTELLSVRVANILQKTDTLPENILCLTFTDSGASAMRERLTDIIGKDAYKVAIHTFHSFCVEVINQNNQYFFNGALFKPADELNIYEIINDIISGLDHNDPLKSQQNGEYTQIKDIVTAISQIKTGGLSSSELGQILDTNDEIIAKVNPILIEVFNSKVSKATIVSASQAIEKIRNIKATKSFNNITPLSNIIADSLENAVIDAGEKDTKPITAWKNLWTKKDNGNNTCLKSHERQIRLHALNNVYAKYTDKMGKSQMYDFDDMILQVLHKIEESDELRFSLHEKFQYIMVDEFQDTNMAQMRILKNLTNNPAHGDTPNIMVVGDDDQAIYSFQGADISNIIDFRNVFKQTKIITLTDNYRSDAKILDHSRKIIKLGKNRLENVFKDINKQLNANKKYDAIVSLLEADNISLERSYIASDIRSKIDSGQDPSEITVIAHEHKEIIALLPYLYDKGILVNYERQDNVLDQDIIKLLENISRLIIYLQTGRHDDANGLIPIVLSHPAWGIEPVELWKLSVQAYDNRRRWLDIMSESTVFADLFNWLINCAKQSTDMPLEQMIDILVGKVDKDSSSVFTSPLYEYFFNTNKLSEDPESYYIYLESLRTIREKLREYHPDQNHMLQTFTDFITLNRKMGRNIRLQRKGADISNAINVMTAHKSKGLEFNIVYIINAVDSNWGSKATHRKSISYPENLTLAPAGDTDDERLRLFYVAMTRAKQQLIISYSLQGDNEKNTLKANFLLDEAWPVTKIDASTNIDSLVEAAELNWYQPIISPITLTMKDILSEKTEKYMLSATHVNSFTDVTRGGPETFLLNNLLRFPSAKSASADFGTSVHFALQSAHTYYIANGKKLATKDVIDIFVKSLSKQHLTESDLKHFTEKGISVLTRFLDEYSDTFTSSQKSELSFSNQQSIIDKAHLTGKLDVIDINEVSKTVTVIDYKTGKPPEKDSGSTDYEKIKIHKYKQQLMFYKLLIESSRDYHGYTVEKGIIQFVEPTKSGKITQISTDFKDYDLIEFTKLIDSIWTHITNLSFPDTSGYDSTFKGTLEFENDLLSGNI